MALIVAPLSQVPTVLLRRKPSHVLTLLGPDAEPDPVCGDAHHLVLRFNDITAPIAGYTAPTADTVRVILAFGERWREAGTGAPLLVHCFAGISRSTAAAYMLACAFSPQGREEALARALRTASPTATPNRLMIALADDMLDRRGRMIASVEALGRGIFAAEGAPFDLVFGG